MVISQFSGESLGWQLSVAYWFCTGKNLRVSHSEAKEGRRFIQGDAHSIDRVWAISEGERPHEVVSFMRVGNFIG